MEHEKVTTENTGRILGGDLSHPEASENVLPDQKAISLEDLPAGFNDQLQSHANTVAQPTDVNPDQKPFPSMTIPDNVDPKTASNNSTAEAKAEVKAVAREQDHLKKTGPIGIDYTSPEEREKTLDEHRKENAANFEGPGEETPSAII